MTGGIGRRRFFGILGAAAVAAPTWARAQQQESIPTVAVLIGLDNDAESQTRIKAFEQGLEKEGWTLGRDVRIVYRFAAGDSGRMRSLSTELAALRPDVIIGHSTPVVTELVRETQTIPIVFVVVADPVGSGFVKSIPRPGGNVTGFTNLDATIGGKLLTILRQLTPHFTRIALMFNPDTVARAGLSRLYLQPFEAAARSFGVRATVAEVHSPEEIERSIADLGTASGAGLIVLPDNFTTIHRHLIIALAARQRIPAIYPSRFFVEAGGLMSYGVDATDLFRRAAGYVNRILKGAEPGGLPVQAPTKFELVINLKTAKALGLSVPRNLLAGADDLID